VTAARTRNPHARKRTGRPAHVRQPQRIRGDTLQRIRRELFAEHPLCVRCLAKHPNGIGVRLATERDHIVPISQGGSEDESNTQALCSQCHAEKTEEEAIRYGNKRQKIGIDGFPLPEHNHA
jgi:5-methylcytosine-specific restriction protein A